MLIIPGFLDCVPKDLHLPAAFCMLQYLLRDVFVWHAAIDLLLTQIL